MNVEQVTAAAESADAASGDFEALQAVIGALKPLSSDSRRRILEAAATFLGTGSSRVQNEAPPSTVSRGSLHPSFSQDTSMSPKEFMLEKEPRTDVERVACLAYYLTHYRDQPNFKTLDLSKLNTEAAQPKFSNAANSSNNAVKRGYLAPSTKGYRQLSAAGERFVLALPDREAAKSAMANLRPRRRTKRPRPVSKNSEA
jgi:hypothetical protein